MILHINYLPMHAAPDRPGMMTPPLPGESGKTGADNKRIPLTLPGAGGIVKFRNAPPSGVIAVFCFWRQQSGFGPLSLGSCTLV